MLLFSFLFFFEIGKRMHILKNNRPKLGPGNRYRYWQLSILLPEIRIIIKYVRGNNHKVYNCPSLNRHLS